MLRWITDQIMDAVMQLSGQEYVDAYGASVKDGAARGSAAAAVVADPAGRRAAAAAAAGARVSEASPAREDDPLNPPQGADVVSVDPSGKVAVEHGSGTGKGIYWVLRHVVLGPAVDKIFRPIAKGTEHVPETGAGHRGQQPPLVRRLAVHAAWLWTAG